MKSLILFLKGVAMGSADVVPGVSGGTIAFITGIYGQLLDAIASINLQALSILRRDGIKAAWQHINGTFLLTLGSGILVAVASLAGLIHYLLQHYPVWLWAFFFGLIIASCWHIGKTISHWHTPQFVALVLGAVAAAAISLVSPVETTASLPILFIAGSVAICAMILPGISGSFILLLMGLYAPIMAAIHQFDLIVLGTLAMGAGLGLMLFSRILSWLLHHYEATMLAVLTGFMAGSLVKVWPWKETLQMRMNSKGELVPFIEKNIMPSIGNELWVALLLMLAGGVIVLVMERMTGNPESN